MKLDMQIGGITYQVEVDVEDEYVCAVNEVSVYCGNGKWAQVKFEDKDGLADFYDMYEDYLQGAYIDHKEAVRDMAYEQAREEGSL